MEAASGETRGEILSSRYREFFFLLVTPSFDSRKTESELTREQSKREETMITKNTTRLVLRFLYLFSILWFVYCFKVSRSCEWGMRWVLVSVELISQSLDDPTLRWPEHVLWNASCAAQNGGGKHGCG